MRTRLRVAAGALGAAACVAGSVGAVPTTGGAAQGFASVGSSAPTIVKELRPLRTATSETYLLSDGTRATKIASAPQHYERPSGAYSPVESRFRRRSGRFEARVASARLALPQRLGTEPVRVSAGGSWLEMTPRGTSAGSIAAGESVRYRSAWRSTDLHYSATTYGLKEEVVLTRVDAPRRFAFALTTSGDLRVKRSADGHVVLRRRGKPVLQIGAPFMVDAAGRYAPSGAARFALKRAGGKRFLVLVLSEQWLSSPKRRFPVVVDPTVYPTVGVDSTIIDGASANTQFSSASTLEVGRSSSSQMRSLLQFNTQAIPSNASVLGATLSLNTRSAPASGGPSNVSVHAVTRPFTSNVTW
jgi:hypothetical protein